MVTVTPEAARRAGRTRSDARSARRRRRILGENPLGMLLSAPYLIFVGVVFAYPLVFAVWMSFHDYFFAAPGADVEREFVGFDNFILVATDPAVWRSFLNVGIFLIINVPLTVVLSLLLATALNKARTRDGSSCASASTCRM